jgi:hypothetical protein
VNNLSILNDWAIFVKSREEIAQENCKVLVPMLRVGTPSWEFSTPTPHQMAVAESG